MTRRLITIDLSVAEYRATKLALAGMEISCKADKQIQNSKTAARALRKIHDAWEARGREGRGLDTRERLI